MKRLFSILMAILMLPVFTTISLAETNATEQNEIYSEQTYSSGAEALCSIRDDSVRRDIEDVLEEKELTVLSVSTTTTYFTQERLSDGTYTYRPMTKEEVHSRSSQLSTQTTLNPDPVRYKDSRLTISLTVSADARRQLWALAHANWDGEGIGDPSKTQTDYDDMCELSWGGNGALKAKNHSITGEYYGGEKISFFEYRSNPSVAYGWSFKEGLTHYGLSIRGAEHIGASVTLSTGTEVLQGKTTSCTFKYTHTYKASITEQVTSWDVCVVATGLPY